MMIFIIFGALHTFYVNHSVSLYGKYQHEHSSKHLFLFHGRKKGHTGLEQDESLKVEFSLTPVSLYALRFLSVVKRKGTESSEVEGKTEI